MPKQTRIPIKKGPPAPGRKAPGVERTGVLKSEPHKRTTIPRHPKPAAQPAPAKPAARKPPGKALDSGNKTVTIKHVSSKKPTTARASSPPLGGMLTGDASIVVGGVVIATGLTVVKQLLDSKLSMRPVIGGFVVGTGLLLLALVNTPIATALTLLIVTTSILTNGAFILEKALKAAG